MARETETTRFDDLLDAYAADAPADQDPVDDSLDAMQMATGLNAQTLDGFDAASLERDLAAAGVDADEIAEELDIGESDKPGTAREVFMPTPPAADTTDRLCVTSGGSVGMPATLRFDFGDGPAECLDTRLLSAMSDAEVADGAWGCPWTIPTPIYTGRLELPLGDFRAIEDVIYGTATGGTISIETPQKTLTFTDAYPGSHTTIHIDSIRPNVEFEWEALGRDVTPTDD